MTAFATSYIPTTTASVTRSADVAQIGTAAFPYSGTEGTLYLAGDSLLQAASLSLYRGLGLSSSTTTDTTDSIRLSIYNQQIRAGVIASSVSQADINSGTLTLNANFKSAMAYRTNDIAASLNGATVVTDTSATLPTGLIVLLLGTSGTTNQLNGHIRQLTYLPRRATNAELQARTA